MKERKEYEAKAEVIVKKLKAKIYELEAKALDAKLKTKKGVSELENKIKSLKNQREKLDEKFNNLKDSGKEKWDKLVIDFEDFIKIVNEDKQDFYDKTEIWISDLSIKIEELEDKAKHANEEVKYKIKEQIGNIRKYKLTLEEKVNTLKESQDENWVKIKKGVDENFHKVKDSISKAFDSLKNKK